MAYIMLLFGQYLLNIILIIVLWELVVMDRCRFWLGYLGNHPYYYQVYSAVFSCSYHIVNHVLLWVLPYKPWLLQDLPVGVVGHRLPLSRILKVVVPAIGQTHNLLGFVRENP